MGRFHFSVDDFEAKPLTLDPANPLDLLKNTTILSACAAHESFFTDYIRGCGGQCNGMCRNLTPDCKIAKDMIISALLNPNVLVWEVWHKGVDFAGILRMSSVTLGCDAAAHYFFFDGRLSDKTPLLLAWKDWAFSDHEGWPALKRVTVQIPTHAFALARHAQKKLGFGGPYKYTFKGKQMDVEGVRKNAVLWRGVWHDEMIMGVQNEQQ